MTVRPLIVLPDAAADRSSPIAPVPAFVPSIWMTGVPAEFGSVVPSIVTGCVSVGSAESRSMVCTPLPGMLKLMAFGPLAAFELMIAWRRLPAPLSLMLVTVKVESIWRPSSGSMTNCRRRSGKRRLARASRRLRYQLIDMAGDPRFCGGGANVPGEPALGPRWPIKT